MTRAPDDGKIPEAQTDEDEVCTECGGDGCYDCMGEPDGARFDTIAEYVEFYSD